jgi:AmmeMemoRadiSam system protein B
LGEIELDRAAIAALLDAGLVTIHDRAHAPEHSLEVELPFLQHALGHFRLVPLLVSDASTDLSHYLADASGRAREPKRYWDPANFLRNASEAALVGRPNLALV